MLFFYLYARLVSPWNALERKKVATNIHSLLKSCPKAFLKSILKLQNQLCSMPCLASMLDAYWPFDSKCILIHTFLHIWFDLLFKLDAVLANFLLKFSRQFHWCIYNCVHPCHRKLPFLSFLCWLCMVVQHVHWILTWKDELMSLVLDAFPGSWGTAGMSPITSTVCQCQLWLYGHVAR